MALGELISVSIDTNIPCMASVDGVIAGRTPICAALPVRRLYIRLEPLSGVGAALCRIVDFKKDPPEIDVNDGALSLELSPGAAVLRARLPCLARERLPYLIAQAEGRSLRALVYFDRAPALALEDANRRALFAMELEETPLSAALSFRENLLLADMRFDGERRLACVSLAREPALLLFEPCSAFEARPDGLRLRRPTGDPLGRELLSEYIFKDGQLLPARESIVLEQTPKAPGPAELAHSLALAALRGDEDWARSLMHPSLSSQLEFDDLRAFFGLFKKAETRGEALCLLCELCENVYAARRFFAQAEGGKIVNISEDEQNSV